MPPFFELATELNIRFGISEKEVARQQFLTLFVQDTPENWGFFFFFCLV
jgi:hypothetical protein